MRDSPYLWVGIGILIAVIIFLLSGSGLNLDV